MKNKLFTLIKYTAINNLSLNKLKRNRAGIIGLITACALALGMGGFVLYIIYAYAYMYYPMLKTVSMQNYLVPAFMFVSSLSILYTIVAKAESTLFKAKDYDALMSMPLKAKTIFTSKLLYLVLINIGTAIMFILPSAFNVFLAEGRNITYLIYAAVISVLVPVIPIILGTLIAICISYVSTKIKHTKIFTTVFLLLTTLLMIVAPMGIAMKATKMPTEAQVDSIVKAVYYPAYLVKDTLANGNIISFAVFTLGNILIFTLFVIILSKVFTKINQKLNESSKSSKYIEKKFIKRSPLFAMYKKELRKLFTTTIYLMNTCIGVLLMVVAVISMLFVSDKDLNVFLNIPNFEQMLMPVLVAMMCGCVAMSSTTGSSISLEGKSLWIYKSTPAKEMDIFMSKILVNLTVTLLPIIISTALLAFRFKFSLLNIGIIILAPSLVAVFVSIFGLLVNLKYPVLNFKSEMHVVKQSTASMISILGSLGILFAAVMAILSYTEKPLEVIYIGMFAAFVFDAMLFVILKSWGVKEFRKIG
ncbi:MAG: hypothetical protein RR922_03790 [Clostridia bacterium]